MVTLVEVGLLAAVLVALFVGYRLLAAIKPFVVNAVVGLVVFVLAGALGFGVQLTPVVLLLVAFGGLPAAILVIVLARFGIVFEPAVVAAGLGL